MKEFRYLLLLVFIFFIGLVNVNAQITTYERTEENHYGVNKKWTIGSDNLPNVLSTEYVDASDKIYDFAGILTDGEIKELKKKIDSFISKYDTELIILTVNEPYFYDSYNETLASDFYDYNDFGLNHENYDGILIYRNAYEEDPYYDIYTFGEAQLYFNQERYDDVLDSVYGSISNKLYLRGFSDFISYIKKYYRQGKPADMVFSYIDDMGYLHQGFVPPYFIASVFAFFITFIINAILVNLNKSVKQETSADIYLDMSTINFTLRKNKYRNSTTTSYTVSSSSGGSSGGGGGHSSSGSSGGGHSSGGGRHG